MKVSGWGRYPVAEAEIFTPRANKDFSQILSQPNSFIPRGMGRSYGDSGNHDAIIQTDYLDHFTKFDDQRGILRCQAGVTLNQILDITLPKGWFLPVTPGTSYVTLGGAIASDVHGKNHHVSGTFSRHINSIELMLADGNVVTTSETELPDLFRATCGGMGLTGVILSAEIQLVKVQSSNIRQTTIKARNLEEVCEKFEEYSSSTYSVAWIDCQTTGKDLGRSLLMLGEHCDDAVFEVDKSANRTIPVNMPNWILNRYSIKAFNAIYYSRIRSSQIEQKLGYKTYFYPLDALSNWNRLYGKAGFVQYQFVLPKQVGPEGLRAMMKVITESKKGSFLAVLKQFGPENANYLSFPKEGYTLALDFKMSLETTELIKRLDDLLLSLDGRIYLTKDALMTESIFKSTYPRWIEFQEVRAKYGAIGKFQSAQSKRLGLE